MARQSAMHLDHHIGHLARLEMWPIVTMARDKSYYRSCCFAVLVSTVTGGGAWYLSVTKGGVGGRGLYNTQYLLYIKELTARDSRAMSKYPQFRSHRNSCFFTWRSRHLFIPVTSDFSHCISLPSRRAAPSLPSPPSSFVRECDPSRRSDAPDFTEALQIRDCMTF